ncbi:ubiquinol-cytochrome C chaperone-domain-containing protein [Sphaerosporella brunnea]|uniref:Ubiquinol-cytochrome C chaperone-domain-containing protein n=1 Tax=Sphaerosporella brunnea TaxID=1250544 RepID=A0A5J5F916_9PEZI|nr:ubiquinol-cytochrome C chaperone-domain-containing protein [Sphaerosporella brunnea]
MAASRTLVNTALRLTPRKRTAAAAAAVPLVATRFFNTPRPAAGAQPADPARPPHPEVPVAPAPPPPLKQTLSLADAIALRFRDYLPNATETYVAYDVTRELYLECARQAAYVDGEEFSESAKFWYDVCNRAPTFQSWSQVTILHMWMLMARMRALDKPRVKIWQQHFIDHFFYDAEDKMVKRYDIKRASERSGYMKDLFHQYRGMTAAFDEGLVKSDAILATALWRNIFDASEDVDIEAMATVTSYVRRALSKLGSVDDDVIMRGHVKFGLPLEERKVVEQKHHYLETIGDSTPVAETASS